MQYNPPLRSPNPESFDFQNSHQNFCYRVLVTEVLDLLPQETATVSIPGYRIKRASLLSIKTSLESAKQLGAVKMKEIVDKEKIKKLYREGHNPPDVSEVHFIQVYNEAILEGL